MDDNLPKQEALVPPTPPSSEAVLKQDSITMLKPLRGLHWAMFCILGVPAVTYAIGIVTTSLMGEQATLQGWIFFGATLLFLLCAGYHRSSISYLGYHPRGWGYQIILPWIMIIAAGIAAGWLTNLQTKATGFFAGLDCTIFMILTLLPVPAYLVLAIISTVILCRRDIKALFSSQLRTNGHHLSLRPKSRPGE